MVTSEIANSILRFRRQRASSERPQSGWNAVVAALCDGSFGGQHWYLEWEIDWYCRMDRWMDGCLWQILRELENLGKIWECQALWYVFHMVSFEAGRVCPDRSNPVSGEERKCRTRLCFLDVLYCCTHPSVVAWELHPGEFVAVCLNNTMWWSRMGMCQCDSLIFY